MSNTFLNFAQTSSYFPSQIEQLSGGPLLHALRRISDLPALPPGVLKTLEWQLRKDIAEVERVARNQSEQQIWLSNNRYLPPLLTVSVGDPYL
jgi:hypothetical protein